MKWMGTLREWMFAEKRTWGAPNGSRGASQGEKEGFEKREQRAVREVGEGCTEAGPQEPRAETVLRKKAQCTRNGVVMYNEE